MQLAHYTEYRNQGLSLPIEIYDKIDDLRGDIPRSKFILRILEKTLDVKPNTKRNSLTNDSMGKGRSSQGVKVE